MKTSYKDIKLIVSDLDGTLLNSNHQISERFFEQFWKLQQEGIQFVAASGRPYYSMCNDLRPIIDHIYIIAENGAIIQKPNKAIKETVFPQEQISRATQLISKIPLATPIYCTQHSAYIHQKNQASLAEVFENYYHQIHWIDDQQEIDGNIVKIAIYHPKNAEQGIYPFVKEVQKDLLVKISGPHWVDIAHPLANKGTALKEIQQELDIDPENTMAFGDYLNDLEMLQAANYSYAMGNAHPKIKEIAKYQTKDNDHFGVENVLSNLLENNYK
ncbi:MAG: Cof-type HAD-IIB family hydrolase [Flavobacteriaceae bacterium]|nr:Cof-type HAD-IIB family hydrolase [Flavobacteriaceae bacterium]